MFLSEKFFSTGLLSDVKREFFRSPESLRGAGLSQTFLTEANFRFNSSATDEFGCGTAGGFGRVDESFPSSIYVKYISKVKYNKN